MYKKCGLKPARTKVFGVRVISTRCTWFLDGLSMVLGLKSGFIITFTIAMDELIVCGNICTHRLVKTNPLA